MDPPTAPQLPANIADRLSLPFPPRLLLASCLAFLSGTALGLALGGGDAGLSFRASNAHRLPRSQVGWYLYHKSKNYHVALGAVREGLRMGLQQAGWVGVFAGAEEGIDRARIGVNRRWRGGRDAMEEIDIDDRGRVVERDVGGRDVLSTVLAGLATAGLFSAWHRLPVPTAARLAKKGAKFGLLFGLAQDALGLLKGRRIGYVEQGKRIAGWSREEAALAG